jgi:hypothetical protein
MMTALWPELGERMFGVVWGFVAIGIGMKLVCGYCYKLLLLALYLGMGWLGLAILRPLLAILPAVAAHWGAHLFGGCDRACSSPHAFSQRGLARYDPRRRGIVLLPWRNCSRPRRR